MLAADEPLFRELRLNGLTMPLPKDRAELKTGSFEWLSSRPARYRINLSGLSLPAVLQGYGLALPGLDTVRLDADISIEEQGQDSILEKGMVKAANLGDLRYSLLISGNTEGMGQQQALFSQTYGDLKLRFEDHGLMARLALALVTDDRAHGDLTPPPSTIFAPRLRRKTGRSPQPWKPLQTGPAVLTSAARRAGSTA